MREIGTHRRLVVFACALGLAHLEVAWRLLFLFIPVGTTAATRAALAAIAVTRSAAIAVPAFRVFRCSAFRRCLPVGFILALRCRNRVACFV